MTDSTVWALVQSNSSWMPKQENISSWKCTSSVLQNYLSSGSEYDSGLMVGTLDYKLNIPLRRW